jgi:hypothetical protein
MPGRNRLFFLCFVLSACSDSGSGTYPNQCQQPLPGWVTNEHGFGILGIASDVRLRRDGTLTFDRKPITDAKLVQYSRQLRDMNPRIFLTFAIDGGASCERVRRIRAIIDAGADCNGSSRGICGEGPGPWPVFGDVPPFPIVQEYKDGHYRWLEKGVSDADWRAVNVRKPKL